MQNSGLHRTQLSKQCLMCDVVGKRQAGRTSKATRTSANKNGASKEVTTESHYGGNFTIKKFNVNVNEKYGIIEISGQF